jgi:hypothetical protein
MEYLLYLNPDLESPQFPGDDPVGCIPMLLMELRPEFDVQQAHHHLLSAMCNKAMGSCYTDHVPIIQFESPTFYLNPLTSLGCA